MWLKNSGTKCGKLFVVFTLVAGLSNQSLPKSTLAKPNAGVVKTALLSFPEFFCVGTEWSKPFAYIGFALQIDGHIRYFKTKTTCQDFMGGRSPSDSARFFQKPIFREQVTVYGGNAPTKLRRESGDLYDIESSKTSTTRSFFVLGAGASGYENPKDLPKNPHPELFLRECRLLTEASEREQCLFYQAGLQTNEKICEELTGAMRESCLKWIKNIREGKIDQ